MKENDLIDYRENYLLEKYFQDIDHIMIIFKKHPVWANTQDFLKYLPKKEIKKLQTGNTFLVIDYTDEGYSSIHNKIFDYIYNNIKTYNIDPSRIIYLSSNLRDNQAIANYCSWKKVSPIHVLGFRNFEAITTSMVATIKKDSKQFKHIYTSTVKNHTDKIYSCLSRVNRIHRVYAAYKLSNSDIGNSGLISHNSLDENFHLPFLDNNNIEKKKFNNWANNLPLEVDRGDFSNNHDWQMVLSADKIFTSTIFHIANESLADDFYKTSLFYTEKTFKPIFFMQPFVIYGQPGINKTLQSLGFEIFDDLFDYSFDEEEDMYKRFDLLLKSILPVVQSLQSMTSRQRVEWRFRHSEKLIKNYNTLINFNYDQTELPLFIEKIRKNNVHS